MTYSKAERASLESRATEIFKLVARAAPSEQWEEWLRVPLEHAAVEGNIDLVNALIGAGANVSAESRGRHGRILLESAALGGNVEVVSALLAAGSPPDAAAHAGSHERSALYLAAWARNEDAARRLVAGGANVHFRDDTLGRDALFMAVESCCEELVNDLLAAGANPTTLNGCKNTTPLHLAAKYGSKGMVSALLASGADKDALDRDEISPLMVAVDNCHRTSQCFAFFGGIHLSAETDYLGVIKTLLAAGADVDIRDLEESTVLNRAAERGHIDILDAILRHGADVNAAGGSQRRTALHLAALNGEAGPIGPLIEAGADAELRDWDGLTPLACAAKYSFCEAMRALLKHGANRDVRGNQGDTLLHLSCGEQDEELNAAVDILLRSGADETAVNDDGRTPLELLSLFSGGCSPEDVERARRLLTRAPADRIWRRRCWLVMLYSRAQKASIASCGKVGRGEHEMDAACGREFGSRSKMTRVGHTSGDAGDSLGQIGDGCVTGAGSEDGDLRAVVESLIGLELDGVLRTVLAFL